MVVDTGEKAVGMKRVLVTGGRNYRNQARVSEALDRVHRKHGISAIIEGGAEGADRCAAHWAFRHQMKPLTFPADWDAIDVPHAVVRVRRDGKKYNAAAGAIRNRRMLEEGRPDVVVAFPGGKGTADMVKAAKKAGLPVWEIV